MSDELGDGFNTRRTEPKSVEEIAAEWDRIADARSDQLTRGRDTSYDQVLAPAVFDMLSVLNAVPPVLDVGSGLGRLTGQLASRLGPTTGVEPSSRSHSLAVASADSDPDAPKFVCASIQAFALRRPQYFRTLVANMTLMDAPDLDSVVRSMALAGAPGATLVVTITHPWFWPFYWGYNQAPWFRYEDEIFIESDFRISAGSLSLPTTHIHRPLAQYVESFTRHGFEVKSLTEPKPSAAVPQTYAAGWAFPRFLGLACQLRDRQTLA